MNHATLLAMAPSLERALLDKVVAALNENPDPEVRLLIAEGLLSMAADTLLGADRVAGDLRAVAELVVAPVTVQRQPTKPPLAQALRDALAALIEHAQPEGWDNDEPDGLAWENAFRVLLRADAELPPMVPA